MHTCIKTPVHRRLTLPWYAVCAVVLQMNIFTRASGGIISGESLLSIYVGVDTRCLTC
jgi:hypothetical protein